MAKINFRAGKYAGYLAAAGDAEYSNTLYFCTDTKQIFKGADNVTDSVIVGIPEVANAIEGKLYVDLTTLEVKVKNGAAFTTFTPGYLTDSVEWATADSGKLATIGLIQKGIAAAIAEIPAVDVSYSEGVLTVGEKTTTLTGLLSGAEYNKDNLRLTIFQVGGDSIVVDLPKDNFVKSGVYDTTTQEIVLTIDDGDESTASSEVRIPAADLVDVYTADNTNKNVKVTVTSDNKISAEVVIDPAEGNALVYGENGFKVDISGKAGKLDATASGHILVGSADGNLADGGVSLKTSGDLTADGSAVVTESLISAAITTAVSAAQGTLQELINGLTSRVGTLEGQVTSLTTGLDGKLNILETDRADEIVVSTAGGQVTLSGKKVGGATLSDAADANTVATEAAVSAALSWGVL